MINQDSDKKNIVLETAKEILQIERKSLKRLAKPIQSTIVDEIIQKFEEVYQKYDNQGNNN